MLYRAFTKKWFVNDPKSESRVIDADKLSELDLIRGTDLLHTKAQSGNGQMVTN